MRSGSGTKRPRRRELATVAATTAVAAVVAAAVAAGLAPAAGAASTGGMSAPTAAGGASTSLSGPATTYAPSTGAGSAPAAATVPTRPAQQDVDADQVFMRADLRPDGDARWAVEYRILLGDDDDRAAFEELRGDVRTNTSAYVDAFRDDVTGTVARAENATGREMAAENVSVAADTQTFGRSYGVVTYTYTWRNFSAVEGDRVRAGDALAGLFLDGSTSLRVEWSDGYSAAQVRPDATDRGQNYVVWEGERSFVAGEPRIVIAPEDSGFAATSPLVIGGGVAAVVVLVAGGAWALRRRSAGETLPGAGADAGDGSATAASVGATAAGAASGAGSADGTAASGAEAAPDDGAADGESDSERDGAGDDASKTAGDDGETAGGPPEELLSNEERVLRLLREHGGRAKQQRVVEELGWTAAKTSQVVNEMRDEGQIEGFRLGRENVLRLPEEDDETEVNPDESG